jgi:hypothetical protein
VINIDAVALAALLRKQFGEGLKAWADVFEKLEAGEGVTVTLTKDSVLLFKDPGILGPPRP